MNHSASWGLHWFRRDLRFAGNTALLANLERHQGRVLGIFFFDSNFLSRPDFSKRRFAFFLETLKALRQELMELGGDLLVLDALPKQGFDQLLEHLKSAGKSLPTSCSFNRDYEPFARNRDKDIYHFLKEKGLLVHTARDHLLIEPRELSRPDGGYYQIFTPFSKRWFDSPLLTSRIAEEKPGLKYLIQNKRSEKPFQLTWRQVFQGGLLLTDQLDIFIEKTAQASKDLPKAGSQAAFKCLEHFSKHLSQYAQGRDYPARKLTSDLSIYLKNGSLTTAQIFSYLGQDSFSYPFLRQLVWREFYYHILWHKPEVETGAFLDKYKHLRWENNNEFFAAWKTGQTGFPIIDAGMRQLISTGGMPNRVRMIVASFLTKDLLIDWRWGERWFMQQLLDGDLAANNGGWQWAASTGCDAVPYFRVFNPETQSKKFDPQGEYIRKWVKELEGANLKEIHAPKSKIAGYPTPIVDHAIQREKAIFLFKQTQKSIAPQDYSS